MSNSSYQSWGRYPLATQQVRTPSWLKDLQLQVENSTVLPYGQGRSYGDCCLNDGGTIIATSELDRLISFCPDTGVLRCEAGATLQQINHFSIPRGWFLPVTPGTQFVSIGGAIANDVHGKNHHSAGTFGRHVLSFELLRSDGECMRCAPDENGEMYCATIAGLGLTGFITRVEIKLQKVAGPFINVELVKFNSLDEFFEISADSAGKFEYTVAWMDCLATGEQLGRGIFMLGNHSERKGELVESGWKNLLTVPIDLPGFALNKLSVKAFNTLYYNKQRSRTVQIVQYYESFFYPLDAVQDWNRIYGKRGFFQFQALIPTVKGRGAVRDLIDTVARSGRASFLVVFKEFGDIESPGMLSFPRPGVTLCFDFPNEGQKTFTLLKQLEGIVSESGGALYPSKDACMSPDSFQQFYPNWVDFKEYIDPGFSSSFWRRVSQGEE